MGRSPGTLTRLQSIVRSQRNPYVSTPRGPCSGMETLRTAPVPMESPWTALCTPVGGAKLPTAFPQDPQGAPALRACPQASHTLAQRVETAPRSPHGPLPVVHSASASIAVMVSALQGATVFQQGSRTHRPCGSARRFPCPDPDYRMELRHALGLHG